MATTPPLWVTIYSKTSTIIVLMIITKRALFFMPAKFHMKERCICVFQYFDLAQMKYWPLKPQEHCFSTLSVMILPYPTNLDENRLKAALTNPNRRKKFLLVLHHL
jgi:hypothetical protein